MPKSIFFRFCALLFCSTSFLFAQNVQLNWSELPPLPNPEGVAGACSGVHNGALIVAGGANFPDKKPWENGIKAYHSEVFVLPEGESKWQKMPDLLFQEGYAASVTTPEGVVCIGGNDATGEQVRVWRMEWRAEQKHLAIMLLPYLPTPLTNATATVFKGDLYVAGGETKGIPQKVFWRLKKGADKWEQLPEWNGDARTHAALVAQSNGATTRLYLIGGRKLENGVSRVLNDVWAFDPQKNTWSAQPPIALEGKSYPISAHSAIASGAHHILLFSGESGAKLNAIEKLNVQIGQSQNEGEKATLRAEKNRMQRDFGEFSRNVMAFHTVTEKWTKLGEMPASPAVTTTAFAYREGIVIPSGEIRPGIRTPKMQMLQMSFQNKFSWLDYAVLIAYFASLTLIGTLFTKRQHSTDDYFRGGGRVPGWAAGVSNFGAAVSAITFISVPAKTFSTAWTHFFLSMSIIFVLPFIIRYIIPAYRKSNITSVYEYLEMRFNLTARIIGGLLFVLMQCGRLAIVILLPSLALSVVTGFSVTMCILAMGIFSIVYCVSGGIEAVVWTEVLQVIVLIGGAFLAVLLILFNTPYSPTEMWNIAYQADKFRLFDPTFDLTTPTFWVVFLGGVSLFTTYYASEQTYIQRYMITPDTRQAQIGMWINVWLSVPTLLAFFSIGTLLYLFYSANPTRLNPTLTNPDIIFPWYIVTELPMGVSGLLIAAILAAAMSTIESCINAVAAVITTDFLHRFKPDEPQAYYLKNARYITFGMGIFGTLMALYMAHQNIPSMWDEFNKLVGLFASGLTGMFILGLFVPRSNAKGALFGLAGSALILVFVSNFTPIHVLLYTFIGLVSSIVLGYIGSLFLGNAKSETS